MNAAVPHAEIEVHVWICAKCMFATVLWAKHLCKQNFMCFRTYELKVQLYPKHIVK